MVSSFLTVRAVAARALEHQHRLTVLAAHQRVAVTRPDLAVEFFGPNSIAIARIAIEEERQDLASLWPVFACFQAANDEA